MMQQHNILSQQDGLTLLRQGLKFESSADFPANFVPSARLVEGMPFLMQVAAGKPEELRIAETATGATPKTP